MCYIKLCIQISGTLATLVSGVARRRKVGGAQTFFPKSEKQKKKKKKKKKKGHSCVKAQDRGYCGL